MASLVMFCRKVSACSMPGNPYDGHVLAEVLERAAVVAESPIATAVVDRACP